MIVLVNNLIKNKVGLVMISYLLDSSPLRIAEPGTVTGPKITGYRTGNLVLIVNRNLNRNHFFKSLKNLTKTQT